MFASLFSLLLCLGDGEVQATLSSRFWVSGMPLSLQIKAPSSAQDLKRLPLAEIKKQLGSPVFRVGEKEIAAAHVKFKTESDSVLYALEDSLKSLPAGEAELVLDRAGAKLASWKLTVLKEASKRDYEKINLEQVEQTLAVLQTSHGAMLLEFFPQKAPKHVRNFMKLAAKGFYDGSFFHRIMKDFMIQGGDPTGTGTGSPGYTVPAEFNELEHRKGILSMARGADPDSAGCQFFIVHGEHVSSLDRQYTAFGKLLDGMETLDKIAAVKVGPSPDGENSRPAEMVTLKKVLLVERPGASGSKKK